MTLTDLILQLETLKMGLQKNEENPDYVVRVGLSFSGKVDELREYGEGKLSQEYYRWYHSFRNGR